MPSSKNKNDKTSQSKDQKPKSVKNVAKPKVEDSTSKTKKIEVTVEEVASAPELPAELRATNDKNKVSKSKKVEIKVKSDENQESDTSLVADNTNESSKPVVLEKSVDLSEPLLEDESNDAINVDEKEEVVVKQSDENELESEELGHVVDDIIEKESDELLRVEDEKVSNHTPELTTKGTGHGLIARIRAWSKKNKVGRIFLVTIFIFLGVAMIVPGSRYYLLNTLRFRGTLIVSVLDESTGQPLKNVNVELSQVTAKTDSTGVAKLYNVRLGPGQLKIKKTSFADYGGKVNIIPGTNNLDVFSLKPTGTQYSFVVNDYLSGKPIEKIEASSGEANAIGDGLGKIKLTVDPDIRGPIKVTFSGDGYRDEAIVLPKTTNVETTIVLTPSRKHVYVSKKSGNYDLYSIDIDGKNNSLLVAGTGNENNNIALLYKPSVNFAALVSTRGNQKNSEGALLSELRVVDVQSGRVDLVASAEHIQLVDWAGDRLIFVQEVLATGNEETKHHKIMSYDPKSKQNTEVASNGYFNDVVVLNDRVYYAADFQKESSAKLYRAEADGSGKVTLMNDEVWNIIRVDYANVALSTKNSDWFNFVIGQDITAKLNSAPNNLVSKTYVDSPDRKNSLWIASQDDKGLLMVYQPESKNDLTIASASGLMGPVAWLNKKDVVYRVSNNDETADYVVSLDGGEPKRIVDVANISYLDDWYYH